ncbi:segregation and condensation protein A [Curtanaerobium respiraculi]|uniref:segregation and condensation protein A n=1 Tax=Curtanaerobium respiraculi TaxID=2949669 RepID=UPI0024B34A23|nr:ScpA family protein [Curtanaerobium respiraculi]
MSFRVRTENFEGPFDLLLYLVGRQRVDIGSVSIAEIADQYLAEMSAMRLFDLDVASDFLLVASTLLEIKAASLLPSREHAEEDEELEELSPSEARDQLVQRLIRYKQFKNAAADLRVRGEAEARLHRRTVGPDASLLSLVPDYLEGQTAHSMGFLAARVLGHVDPFLLDSDHIAAKPIPVEVHVRGIHARVQSAKHLAFSSLVGARTPAPLVVVSFLAVLELYKRGMIRLSQPEPFGDIQLDYIEGSGPLSFEGGNAISSAEE